MKKGKYKMGLKIVMKKKKKSNETSKEINETRVFDLDQVKSSTLSRLRLKGLKRLSIKQKHS